jgi:ubiquinone/menaquinone biosynthesis C-methylase UbiE
MTETINNVYDDADRARAYADLEFPGTYYLAFRDLPALLRKYASGTRALDFGCGTGRSTRFLREMAFEVIGVDVSEIMLNHARGRDPSGDYRLVADGSLAGLGTGTFDVILAAFTFDNTPTDRQKTSALREFRRLLAPRGCVLVLVSAPAIYWHEWASFSTRDYPANLTARDGDSVHIVMLDVPDRRPVVDVMCSDSHYRELFESVGLSVVDTRAPLASGAEPVQWVSETRISPWNVYVLGAA